MSTTTKASSQIASYSIQIIPSSSSLPTTNISSISSQRTTILINISTLANNNILITYTGDLSACLANCSNQGVCILNSEQKYVCHCNQYRTGSACQSESLPCASYPCLNGGVCSNTNNDTTFQCMCVNNLYYGANCENKLNLCLNSTVCFNNQGYCIMNDTQPVCKCKQYYSGVNCETISSSLATRKNIINASTVIAIITLVCFVITVFCMDFTKYFVMNRIDRRLSEKREILKPIYHPWKN